MCKDCVRCNDHFSLFLLLIVRLRSTIGLISTGCAFCCRKMKKLVFINLLVALLVVLTFDLCAFFLLSEQYAFRFPAYRMSDAPDTMGRAGYPSGYFVKHEQRGFDIGRYKKGDHWVSGTSYPIWSNSLGCFDREHENYENYVYFAGDSFTWGYAPFEKKFGSLIEQVTGTVIFKCGVTHSGQRHQLAKLQQLVEETGQAPSSIFVFHYWNDLFNDYAYPHSTVIDGWMVDNVRLDSNDELVLYSDAQLKTKFAAVLTKNESNGSNAKRLLRRVRRVLLRYSLSLNMVRYLKQQLSYAVKREDRLFELDGNELRGIHSISLEKNGKLWYLDNANTKNNQSAITAFAEYAEKIEAKFVVVVIPPRQKATDPDWSAQLKQYLSEQQIEYLDLASRFAQRSLTATDLYWPFDGHFHVGGNKIVSEILLQEFDELLQKDSAL